MTIKVAKPDHRIQSIDILRGIVMVVMALDHTRDFFSGFKFEPTDLQHASTAMFLTRWVTHFCAPVFILLSGTSAFLSLHKMQSKKKASWRLASRGLWLIVLELTLVRLGWTFDFHYSLIFLQVIWAIGVSMLALALLIHLPWPAILTIGLVMIFGHNALDNLHPAHMGTLWHFLHEQGPVTYGNGNTIMVFYPLIPWIGVMAVGYVFGYIFPHHSKKRHYYLYMTGASVMMLFVLLRLINCYGDPQPWVPQENDWRTALSFVNCTKYPPSLLYLLMTLGPAITIMPLLEHMGGWLARVLTVYGRVPMFYYILHLYLIHGMALLASLCLKGNAPVSVFGHPGYTLVSVYLFWITAVVILYFPSRWYMGIKQRHKKWWLSYL